MKTITELAGILERRSEGWFWIDGEPAPYIEDIKPSRYYKFSVSNFGSRYKYIEIPVGTLREAPELKPLHDRMTEWKRDIFRDAPDVPEFHLGFGFPTYTNKKGASVVLVPLQVWDAYDAEAIVGARWPKDRELEIMAKVKRLQYADGRLADRQKHTAGN